MTSLPADTPRAPAPELLQGIQLSKFFVLPSGALKKAQIVRAVQDASIEIGPAETVGLVGESGSGKTTLGRLLLRLIEPTYGQVWFEGREITYYHERDLRLLRKSLQVLFQDAAAALDDRWTVSEILAEPFAIHGQLRFGISQGGIDRELRARSLEEITSLSFDGYALGGLAVGEPREEMLQCVEWAAACLPADRPRYFMGIGDPGGFSKSSRAESTSSTACCRRVPREPAPL